MARPKAKTPKPRTPGGARAVYTVEIQLLSGPVTEEFTRDNPKVVRTIQIAGDQTLEDLHEAIYAAFDRDDEHLYEFQIGGRKPYDLNSRSYAHPDATDPTMTDGGATHSARGVRVGSLDLKPRGIFFYWFDFGDDWWHKVKVVSSAETVPDGPLPRVTHSVGASPPQYPYEYIDDEEEEQDDAEFKDSREA